MVSAGEVTAPQQCDPSDAEVLAAEFPDTDADLIAGLLRDQGDVACARFILKVWPRHTRISQRVSLAIVGFNNG